MLCEEYPQHSHVKFVLTVFKNYLEQQNMDFIIYKDFSRLIRPN